MSKKQMNQKIRQAYMKGVTDVIGGLTIAIIYGLTFAIYF